METATQILEASDPEGLLGDHQQILEGFLRESLVLTRDFEPHFAEHSHVTKQVGNLLLPDTQRMDPSRRLALMQRFDSIIWHSLKPIYGNLFEGREVDVFGLSGTLQRAAGNFKENQFQDIAERIIDLCKPVRLCEGNFELEAVVHQTFAAWSEDLIDLGALPEVTEEFEALATDLIQQVLSIAAPELVKAISDGITLPE